MTTPTAKAAGKGTLRPLVGPPEVLPPTTDLRTFLMRLHRLAEDAQNIEWPDPVAVMNAAALVDILKERMLRPNKPIDAPAAGLIENGLLACAANGVAGVRRPTGRACRAALNQPL